MGVEICLSVQVKHKLGVKKMLQNRKKHRQSNHYTGTEDSRRSRLPDSRYLAHENGKIVIPKHRPPLPPENISLFISFRGWVDTRAMVRHEGLCRIISMKISNDAVRNRNRDFPVCSTVPQPNAPRCAHTTIEEVI
jgi:hypothetical protein